MVQAGKEDKNAGEFRSLLETSPGQAARYLEGVHAADRAQWLRDVGAEDAWRVFGELRTEDQAELIEYADDDLRAVLIVRMSAGDLRGVLDELPSDEAADLLGEADTRVAEDVLAAIDSETAQELRELAAHEPDTAGGIMATEFVTVGPDERVGDAVKAIRKQGDDAEEELAVFVVDDEGRPLGFLPDRVLLSQPIHTPVLEAMVEPITVGVAQDQEEAARLVEKYGLLSLGVVDEGGSLIGVISADDAAEVLAEEAEEDLLRMAGASVESLHGRATVLRRVRNRLPLMGITVLSGLLSAKVLRWFLEAPGEGAGTSDILRYLPLIIGLAGNVGVQSSTILVRAIAMGELEGPRQRAMLRSETLVGVVIGFICGLLLAGVVSLLEPGQLGLAVGIATAAAILCAALMGTSVPVVCMRMGIDPAIVAGPFLICLSDVSGSVLFVAVAKALLQA
jgi:magnesium transporter